MTVARDTVTQDEPGKLPDSQSLVLSICVPTFNRAHLLEIALQALVGQVAEQLGRVELLIGDNASTDGTLAIVASMQQHAPIRIIRQTTNLGAFGNILNLVVEHAKGEYVLVLGDDDLIRSGALVRLVNEILRQPKLDAFYINFRIATDSQLWPDSSWGGYDGDYNAIGNSILEDRELDRWITVACPQNEMCTHIYSHVVKRRIWMEFWKNRPPEAPYRSIYSTYPHTAMLIERAAASQAFYIGEPMLTAFYGSMTWEAQRPKVFLAVLPDLLELALKHGMHTAQYEECRRWVRSLMVGALNEALARADGVLTKSLCTAIRMHWNNLRYLRLLYDAIRRAGCRKICRGVLRQVGRRC